MIDTSKIIPTHNRFRNSQKAKELIEVKEYCDYILNNQRSPIVLIQTEDCQLWCHDGHHRLAAIDWHYGEIDNDYVSVKHYTYAQLNEINLSVSYVTPYDPRIECRHEDFWKFKKLVLESIDEWCISEDWSREDVAKYFSEKFIKDYKQPRRVHTLRELCNTVLSLPPIHSVE